REIEEETGLHRAVSLVRRGEPFAVVDEALGTRWIVHPFLFECAHRYLRLDWETTEAAWTPPPDLLRRDTVPQLWTSYSRVAPTVESIRSDRVHGSARLSYRALEVLRDRAGWMIHQKEDTQTDWAILSALARRLLEARPSMAALRNRVNRVMHTCRDEPLAEAIEREAQAGIERALTADEGTAQRAAGYVAGRRVFTLSRSGTVLDALRQADPPPTMIVIAESRPGGEGAEVADELAREGRNVMLVPDTVLLQLFEQERVDVALVGADTVLPSGGVVNKVGTHLAALAAKQHHLPFYVASASDKVSTDDEPHLEMGNPDDLYAGPAPVEVFCPLFEVTPAKLLSGIITEYGVLAPVEMKDLAFELKALEAW
ncbi:MAG: initiation factor 2B, partial [Rhodothermales bacterium]